MIVYGLLVSAGFIIAGLYLSLDFLVARKLLPEKVASQIRPQGVNIGIAVCVIAVLHLLLGGTFWVL